MYGELRPFVAGFDAARLAPDRLAVLGKVRQFACTYGGSVELFDQSEFNQLANRMRQHIDTDAERLQFSHALEDFGRDTDLMQAESQRQSANSSACNKNGHVAL